VKNEVGALATSIIYQPKDFSNSISGLNSSKNYSMRVSLFTSSASKGRSSGPRILIVLTVVYLEIAGSRK
jgi:hypothetical protein